MTTKNRHSFVAFYASDWLAGTARMTRLVKSVYHDICLYTWDTGRKVPDAELVLMLADLEGQGDAIVNALVKTGKLLRDDEGNVWSERALAEAKRSFDLWEKKSQGGRKGRQRGSDVGSPDKTPSSTPPIEPYPEPEILSPKESEEDTRAHEAPLSGRGSVQLRKLLGALRAGLDVEAAAGLADIGVGEAKLHAEAEAKGEYADVDGIAPDKPRRPTRADCAAIMEAWNAMAKKAGLPQAVKLTGSREDTIRVRIEEMGAEQLLEAIAKVPGIPFLLGKNNRGWKADFDPFFIRPNSAARILEGGYENGSNESPWRT